jgi:macrolide transport system ATP-binding/permease protein
VSAAKYCTFTIRISDHVDRPVVGILEAASADPALLGAVIVTPNTTTKEAPSRVRVLVHTGPGAAKQVGDRIAFAVDPRAVDRIRVQVPVDPTTLRAEVESDVQTTLIAFTGVAVLAAIAALTNAMVLAVLERRAELGLRRAIGARRRHVRALVLAEAALLGVVGGAGGLVLGLTTILAITIARGWGPVLDPGAVPLALVGGLAVGLLGGLVAAWRAARLDPQEALRL